MKPRSGEVCADQAAIPELGPVYEGVAEIYIGQVAMVEDHIGKLNALQRGFRDGDVFLKKGLVEGYPGSLLIFNERSFNEAAAEFVFGSKGVNVLRRKQPGIWDSGWFYLVTHVGLLGG
ncbi:hypothetical protein ACFTAO_05855 [Paenibacillus rhizoplanae]